MAFCAIGLALACPEIAASQLQQQPVAVTDPAVERPEGT
jgi:hypothetical protein